VVQLYGFALFNNYNRLANLANNWVEKSLPAVGGGSQLAEALSYCLFPGGKRLRPVLVCAVAEAMGLPLEKVRSLAVAVEFIHTSSLIHDDLPALDNDDERRGRPSCHKKFGEDLAVLAGDLLLAAAFRVVSEATEISDATKVAWCRRLSTAIADLCEGQLLDLRGQSGEGEKVLLDSHSRRRDQLKTGALFQAAIVGPLDCLEQDFARTKEPQLAIFANDFGMLFQLTDDLLDLAPDASSRSRGNLEAEAAALFAQLIGHLEAVSFGGSGEFLKELCIAMRERSA